MGVVHRDLKLENILMRLDGSIALIDFGFATHWVDRDHAHQLTKRASPCSREDAVWLKTACGSPCYAAPELVLDREGYYGPAVDLWSCGVILYAMLFGHLPFEATVKKNIFQSSGGSSISWTPANVYQLYEHIVTNPLQLPIQPMVSIEAGDLVTKLLEPEPRRRISMEQVWRHPWMENGE